ncbi:RelA/SpoT family protein [Paenibacillus puldeungensis]|uniref:GTP pyrophosphokinase n=1 Tax=Paenibacillus puldeungensis TaxID=696536 RepID=A0ABW3RY41_9BACL
MGIEQLLEKASAYIKESDLHRIREAYEFAEQAHHGQVRKSGEPYILHPLAVADIVVNMQMDVLSIIAALLHDVVEDTTVSLKEIQDKFGGDCALLVDGLTKLERIKFRSKEEQQNENYRKMFIAMAQDIRVIVIKLADRLHNMRTLKYQSEESQRRIAYETLEIFCPIANRLGISAIKWEMEDIALRYLNPQQYYRIANLMRKKRAEREEYIKNVISRISEKLDEMGVHADLSGRPKHIYSVYKKMTVKNKQFNEIYDLLAIRIIVDNIKDCYATLGIIHTLWKPMPGRFKDYIAMPKANMYQSLHTTVVGPNGEPTEVQIRTWDMHRTAEYGIAAHWAYKEGTDSSGMEKNRMTFFSEILELQHEAKDASEFVESLKMDFFSDLVFVFTPSGEVIELPAGSVPLDFAYRIHTEVGNRTIGSKVNGRIVPLDHKLKTGDIVEILTSKHSYGPSQDWLKIAQSSHARSKIKQWFKKEKREENVEKGRDAIERELKRAGIDSSLWMTDEKLLEAAKKYAFNDIDDMLSAIGFGGITASQVVTKLTEKLRKEQEEAAGHIELTSEVKEVKAAPEERKHRPTNGVVVKGIDNLLVRFARCCNPVPGDEIVGYITRGRGVSVHRSDCPNIPTGNDGEEAARVIDVEWEDAIEANYSVDIEITGHDRRNFLNEVLQAVSESKTNISAVSGRSDKNKMALVHMTILIRNTDHLQSVVEKIKRVKDVYTVHRIMQ